MQVSITYKSGGRTVKMVAHGNRSVGIADDEVLIAQQYERTMDDEPFYDPECFAHGSIHLWMSKADAVRLAHGILAEVDADTHHRLAHQEQINGAA